MQRKRFEWTKVRNSITIFSAMAVALMLAGQIEAGPFFPRGAGPGIHPHSKGRPGPGVCPQPRSTPSAPDQVYRLTNPLEPTQENIEAGEALFQIDTQPTACKICHGEVGNGLGMMAPGMTPPPRNFTCKEVMKDIPDGQLYWTIKKGSPGTGMPPYPGLTEKQIWQIVLYLRGFSK